MKTALTFLLFLCYSILSIGQTQQELNNIEAFNRLYGYIRFFHPSDEASSIDWNNFAVYGCSKVRKAKNGAELEDILEELFTPIAPSLKIFQKKKPENLDIKSIVPENKDGYSLICWQHLGLGLGDPNNIYESQRSNRPNTIYNRITRRNQTIAKKSLAFINQDCKFGEYISKDIGGGLHVISPLVLYGDSSSTYPKADSAEFASLQNNLKSLPRLEKTDSNLGALVITWNIMQHFYPYFDAVKTDWNKEFMFALKEAFDPKVGFVLTLRKMTAKLNDGHLRVREASSTEENSFKPPINWELVEDQLVITAVFDDSLKIKPGDIVTEIDAQPSDVFLDHVRQYISAGTSGWRNYRACQEALSGDQNSILTLTIKSLNSAKRKVSIKRSLSLSDHFSRIKLNIPNHKISDEIYYVNLVKSSWQELKGILPELQTYKNIIFDLRGYPNNNNHQILRFLLHREDTSDHWMKVPKITHPDREGIIEYQEGGWNLKTDTPQLKSKIYFLVNGQAISYAESLLSLVEGYKLAAIIGQPTAGTNGNMNYFTTPGGYRISFTGMRVVKHNGTQHHAIGIIPNVFVERTIEGVRTQKDEYLEKAISLASQGY